MPSIRKLERVKVLVMLLSEGIQRVVIVGDRVVLKIIVSVMKQKFYAQSYASVVVVKTMKTLSNGRR